MAFFKYIPYLFLVIALVFSFMAVQRYAEGGDGFPYLLLAVGSVGYFFVRRYISKEYEKQKK